MYARDASFGDDLRQAYGIEWAEDLFGPADEDNRYTTNVEELLGAQQEWMASNVPKKGTIVEVNNWGQPDLPKKAERVYGKPGKGDCTAIARARCTASTAGCRRSGSPPVRPARQLMGRRRPVTAEAG
ncbi:hypothetical protein GGD54_005356 [Rhizobium tropici]|nr:hypothetical protein [Rhizobium tropici]MBB4569921.1 hypothetical protein [Rhizobium leucaenae]MBB5576173.1 hypothetical protein [Rhizobium paranaense]MBB6489426.1 hypothetical protein [Rhizobium lusitanum]MBB5596007.1 hypothetical protein [Rhizobium tropici]